VFSDTGPSAIGDSARNSAAVQIAALDAPVRSSTKQTQKTAPTQHSVISTLKIASYAPSGASDGPTNSGIAPGGYSTKKSR
jgi:hypothetical protein